ncbi:MAG: hypothetical protein ABFD51_02480 [Anaerolineaceae bacterium]
MTEKKTRRVNIDIAQFYILNQITPFVEIMLSSYTISPLDFARIVEITFGYRNDPRLIEMVRQAGDGSAKVPYLIDSGETPQSILEMLREIAEPHVDYIQSLPDAIQATIIGLLSINTVPQGCERYGIPALLELDRIQGKITEVLKDKMGERKLAQEYYKDNIAALRLLDKNWERLRSQKKTTWQSTQPLPERSEMQFVPVFEKNRLIRLYETCVIVDSPGARTLQRFIPPVLKRPLPENEPLPAIGSADWLIREVGKVGRHFTRALLKIVNDRLESEKINLEAKNYEMINRQAQEALKEFIERTP